ncbi:MAG: CmcI family methyltransferase [Glycocaulis sp.]
MTPSRPDISLIICAYNMSRELPRTLFTLSPAYQRGIEALTVETIVLDNGSAEPVDEAAVRAIIPGARMIRVDDALPSPAEAINAAVAASRGQLTGLWIDGARMATPGILARAHDAWRQDSRNPVATLAFHLGPDMQTRSVLDGYDAAAEDALLDSVPWQKDGYRLFDIAVLAGSSRRGWFGRLSETNGLFMDRALWDRLGGLDTRFASPGGGYVNLDLWQRAVKASRGNPWMILGEGTFHQIHGGAATSSPEKARAAMRDEYERIIGAPFKAPRYTAKYTGELDARSFAAGTPDPRDETREVHALGARRFRVDLPAHVLSRIQKGTLKTRYRGLRLAKNPFDLVLYAHLVESLRPGTIIEVGTSEGGSAVWFRDLCDRVGLGDTGVISIDISPPGLSHEGVRFFAGDAAAPEESFPSAVIEAAPRPWLVIEDSAHTYETVSAVLAYFDARLQRGDRIIVEDGVVADLPEAPYRKYEDGPNAALADFMKARAGDYVIDEKMCDFYGPNVTWAPNGWLKRV